MYRAKIIPVGHSQHSGKSEFEEVKLYYNYDLVDTFSGPTAKIKARNYVTTHAWFVRKNEYGLDDLDKIAA